MTTTSAQLNVDPFEQTEDKNNKTTQQNCTTEQLQVSQNISEFDYVTLFWTEEEIRNRASVETIDVANSFTLRNLSSGLFYCFEVTPIDNCTNEIKDNSSLTICAPTGKWNNNDMQLRSGTGGVYGTIYKVKRRGKYWRYLHGRVSKSKLRQILFVLVELFFIGQEAKKVLIG